ncbi:hypothetical protein LTR97_006222 [Elasticomyces elasticus]|uniref:Arylamine N-acetyltransferase n=1 Tax=Elasticomyces elasticus TaxID=574655 RepID=A0AAN7ZU50_9PEZI|nr:hypothetical protein LTR97_006222 [Elasticomyces elasticus]
MASAYSQDQISRFLSMINLPEKYRVEANPTRDLALLSALHTYTISSVPYENLLLHYSPARDISLEPGDLYRKIVLDGRGRGGYCMENSIFYLNVLRGLGFNVYPTGVRIRLRVNGIPQGDYVGWVHMVNIVTLPDGQKYMIDVGFGGDGATKPVPMARGQGEADSYPSIHNIGTQELRLVRDFIPGQTVLVEEAKLWIYQYRNGPTKDWNSFFAFPEIEFLPLDFEVMNWFTMWKSFQRSEVLIIRFLRRPSKDKQGEDEVYGKRMLINGVLKENMGGKTVVVKECMTERERVEAVKELFGIELSNEEKVAIQGYVTELR